MASLQCRRPLPREVITVHISYFLRLGHEEAFGQSAGPLSEAGGRKASLQYRRSFLVTLHRGSQ